MPRTQVLFYADKGNVAPVLQWLDEMPQKVQEKLTHAVGMIEQLGHEARRPLWAPLRDGVYELRVRHLNVNYRILCFFHGRSAIVAAHGCTKERAVDPGDIEKALIRMKRFEANPALHTYQPD